jgi:hypothetical protein
MNAITSNNWDVNPFVAIDRRTWPIPYDGNTGERLNYILMIVTVYPMLNN